jgi:hypothetical protein
MLQQLVQHEASAIDVCWGIYTLWQNKKPLKKEDIAAEAKCSVFFVDECLARDHGLMELFRNAQAGHQYVFTYA